MLDDSTVIGQKQGKDLTIADLKKIPLDLQYVTTLTDELCLVAIQHCKHKVVRKLIKLFLNNTKRINFGSLR